MSESFVVSAGGNDNDKSVIPEIKYIKLIAPTFVANFLDSAKYHRALRIFVAVITVLVIILIIVMAIGGFVAVRNGNLFSTYTNYKYGKGAASARDLRFGGPFGIGGEIQGMKSAKLDTMKNAKLDTFLATSESPVFNDVPNYILRKENRMQDALFAYSKLRKNTTEDVPDWATYWKDWQTSRGYDYDVSAPESVHPGETEGYDSKRYDPSQLRTKIY